jgi:hypothetical protein
MADSGFQDIIYWHSEKFIFEQKETKVMKGAASPPVEV